MSYEMEYTFKYVDVEDMEHDITGTVVLNPITEPNFNMTRDILIGWEICDFKSNDTNMDEVWLEYIIDYKYDEVVDQWENMRADLD